MLVHFKRNKVLHKSYLFYIKHVLQEAISGLTIFKGDPPIMYYIILS